MVEGNGRQTEATTDFGDLLRRLRTEAGLSQHELAGRAGISENAVGTLERGERRRPHPHTTRALADALHLSEGARNDLFRVAIAFRRPDPLRGRAEVVPSSLPAPLTRLVGREREVDSVARQLGQARLVTLTGPGGVGKTRLAIEAARSVEARFPDGVYLVPLASLERAELVSSAIARAVGLAQTGGQPASDVLRAGLRGRQALLLIDNFEHLMAAAPQLSDLLRECPDITALVTSREALRVQGERRLEVQPLAATPAAELFLARAADVTPGFDITADNAVDVGAVCLRLEGLPLAIELAAAHVRVLPPAALLARLDRALPMLVGGARDLPARHQTMRATLAWSHDLLDESERAMFRQLSVLAGGWTLEAAEAIACPVQRELSTLEAISRLVDRSLVIAEPGDEPRFRMLEIVREYGLERLAESGEETQVRTRHLRFFVELAEAAAPHLFTPDRTAWLMLLERGHDDIRAALEHAAGAGGRKATDGRRGAEDQERAETGLRLAGALAWFWFHAGFWSEGRARLTAALASAGPSAPPGLRVAASYGAGMLACFQGERTVAHDLLEGAVDLCRELGDARSLIPALHLLSVEVLHRGDDERARELAEESVTISRETQAGDVALLGSLCAVGMIARAQDDLVASRAALVEATGLRERMADDWMLALPLRDLAVTVARLGDHDRAHAMAHESLFLLREASERWFASRSIDALAMISAFRGRFDQAARLYGAAEALTAGIGSVVLPNDASDHEQGVAATREALGVAAFDRARAEGRAMSPDEAVAFALGTPTGASV